ncbi:uncharacterized protein [Rhodnius prolixus]|uniref:uncharacterized protein n=1 Tax=Rhodnius prolixus TaxID=13249 RepID=UPI003D18D117
MAIRMVQANLHHAKAASAVLSRRFDREGLHVALLQEPWCHGGIVRGLNPKFGKVLYKSVSRPRACIVHSNKVSCGLIPELCSADFVTALLIINTEEGAERLVISSAYFPGDEDLPLCLLKKVMDYCRGGNLQLVLGCDANAHNIAWGSTDINQRGKYLYEFITGEGLHVANVGLEPTFVTAARREVLDVTLASRCMLSKIAHRHVSSEPSCSDHRLIRFDICTPPLVISRLRSPRETHWEGFVGSLSESLGDLKVDVRTIGSLGRAVAQVTEAILDAYRENCPERERPNRSKTVWWNDHLERRRREVRRLFNKAKINQDWASYLQLQTTTGTSAHLSQAYWKTSRPMGGAGGGPDFGPAYGHNDS